MNFPLYNAHADVECFNCRKPAAVALPNRSGYCPGTGAWVSVCQDCGMRTFYDVREAPDHLHVGDRVAYTYAWMKATGSLSLQSRRGRVSDAGGTLVRVAWDDLDEGADAPVLQANLERVETEPY